jgi:hypothetical protein
MMARHVIAVLSEPVEGKEDEFNDWYENTHIDEVLSSAVVASGERFRLSAERGAKCPLPYLAFYEVEAESGEAAIKRLEESRGERQQSDAFNFRSSAMWVFESMGPRHEA